MEPGEKKPKKKCCPLRRSRKGCMKGKGGPENPFCTYRGVRQRTWGKWVAEIREPNHGARLWLGTFNTSLEAAIAYDEAARTLYGDCARLNLSGSQPPRCAATFKGSTPPAVLQQQTEMSCSPSSQSTTTEASTSGSMVNTGLESPVSFSNGIGEWDDFVTRLPKMEDLGLDVFNDICPPMLIADEFVDREMGGDPVMLDALQFSWCY